MRVVLPLCMVAAMGIAGCRFPWEPEFGPIVGTVRYLSGKPALRVDVSVVGEQHTLTDLNGRYRLDVPAGRETVVVSAVGPAVGAGNPWGLDTVAVRRGRVEADIVLDGLIPD